VEGRPGEGAGQGVEEGVSQLGKLLMDVLELAAGGAGQARLAAAFVIETSRPAGLARVRRSRPRLEARPRGDTWNRYTGHGSLLDVNAGRYLHCTRKAPLCALSQKGPKSKLSERLGIFPPTLKSRPLLPILLFVRILVTYYLRDFRC